LVAVLDQLYELTRENSVAVKSYPTAEEMDCLTGDPFSLGKAHSLMMKLESLVRFSEEGNCSPRGQSHLKPHQSDIIAR